MKTKEYSKDTQQILDSQERVLAGCDEVIRKKQAEMLEKFKQKEAEKAAKEEEQK